MSADERLTDQLLGLLGRDAFVRLAETYGGRRLYIPIDPEGTDLEQVLFNLGHTLLP